jgi:hypothetical protein
MPASGVPVPIGNQRTLGMDCTFEGHAAVELHFEVMSGGGSFALVANSRPEATALPIKIRH